MEHDDLPDEVEKNVPLKGGGLRETDGGRLRFEWELEFVQCLANPSYIHFLAQSGYFDDESFVGYLKYLQYWQRTEYVRFIVYPHTFFFLELLQNAGFRLVMSHQANKDMAHRQQFYFWNHYRNNRLQYIEPRLLPEEPEEPAALPARRKPKRARVERGSGSNYKTGSEWRVEWTRASMDSRRERERERENQ
ncbi:hypothetical protein Mapa_005728 [Marchantia paleacea]|nr:hypothetical protein Mapa_005728 [Marchantia paleacea]